MDQAPPSAYFEDASGFRGHADHVYSPQSESEVQRILVEASASRTPVTISGAGTGVTGGRVPFGGIVVSLGAFPRHRYSVWFGARRRWSAPPRIATGCVGF